MPISQTCCRGMLKPDLLEQISPRVIPRTVFQAIVLASLQFCLFLGMEEGYNNKFSVGYKAPAECVGHVGHVM